jgi:hypothetical protein
MKWRISKLLFLGLMTFSPLVRGGHQDWASLVVTGALGLILVCHLVAALWRGSLSIVWCRDDAVILMVLVWLFFGLKQPVSAPDGFVLYALIVGFMACFVISRRLAYEGSLTQSLAVGMTTIGGIVALTGLFQLFGLLPHHWWKPAEFMASTFVNHNQFAGYLEMLFPLGVVLLVSVPQASRALCDCAVNVSHGHGVGAELLPGGVA